MAGAYGRTVRRKIAVADPKEEYSFTQLKMYAQKGGTYLRKWMTGTAPVAIYMEKAVLR